MLIHSPIVSAYRRAPAAGLAWTEHAAHAAAGRNTVQVLGSRILVAAFDGWNDAGEAASAAAEQIDDGAFELVHAVDPELYFDYQWARPTLERDQDGNRSLRWPSARMQRPTGTADDAEPRLWLLTGTEPARAWQAFSAEFVDAALSEDITGVVTLGAMLSDVPHTRPISIFASSESAEVREALGIERSTYEGPIGILSALDHAAEQAGIPTLSLWANVPHYVQTGGASPKATLAAGPAARSDRGRRAPGHARHGGGHVGGHDRRGGRRGRGDGGLHRAARGQARHLGFARCVRRGHRAGLRAVLPP